jgi:hypothetical protein
MKLLAMLFAAAGLTGCVAYPAGYGGGYYGGTGYYGQGGYYGHGGYVHPYYEPSVTVYGGSRYRNGPGSHRWSDRDRDGVPDRFDRDRDGDGVPNQADRRPSNPRRH